VKSFGHVYYVKFKDVPQSNYALFGKIKLKNLEAVHGAFY